MLTIPRTELGRVAVLLGGSSAEREISLNSGGAVLAALQRLGIDAVALDPAVDVTFWEQLRSGQFARVLIMLHGRGGEDGVMQGVLEYLKLPYTGSRVMGSAISMDKVTTKRLWQSAGLPTAEFVLLHSRADCAAAQALGFPLMIKPAHEGSSLGMTKVEQLEQLEAAFAAAAAYDSVVLAERWLAGAEYTCAILGTEALPLIRLETPNGFYDFDAKYQATTTQYHCPCGLDADTEAQLQALCLQAFAAVGASGWGRVDLMLDEHQQPHLLEINTAPGMTDHSLVPMAARAHGLDFDALVERILATSWEPPGKGDT